MNPESNLSIGPHQHLLKTAKGVMLARLIILTLLLAITFLFQLLEKKYFFIHLTNQFYYFISLFYLVTILYAIYFKKVTNFRQFILIQIVVDHLFVAGLIYFTGGKASYFPTTYIFLIIGSSILFYKRGAFWSASFSTLLYGLLLLFQLYQWIHFLGQPSVYDASQIFYSLVIYLFTFYIVAILSSSISEELKKKKKELFQKQVDYDQLEAFNQNIIRSLDCGLLTIDLKGRINFLNRTAEVILNHSLKELITLSIYDLFPEINRAIDKIRKKSVGVLSDYQRYETFLTNQNGRKIHLGFSISPLIDPGGSLIGHTLIFQDITKFKEMEDQMKRVDKLAAIGLLAAGMAHEIRNPLAALSGSIQMLESELNLDEQQKHLMQITLRESERLNSLITDFLLFAHPPQTHKMRADIIKIVDETIELFIQSPFFHDGFHFHRSNHSGDTEAMIDPEQMRQVFWNLLINASQSMPDGGEIRIQFQKIQDTYSGMNLLSTNQKKGMEWVKISITDSGNGIGPQEIERIFDPFYTTKERGTGLGLSIVHKIIENHHGMIKVESEVGKGSTFTILLPVN